MNGADSRDDPAANEHGPVRVHEPVLLQECLSVADLQPGMTVVDGTVGAGGHASAFARVLGPSGLVVGLDRDVMNAARPALFDKLRDRRIVRGRLQ